MAEAVFKHKVALAGLSDVIQADFAGTSNWSIGEQPHSEVRKILDQNNISYDHKSRIISPIDLAEFNNIVTMDNKNLQAVTYLGKRKARLEPLLKYAPGCGYGEIPDPMGTGNFDLVYELVSRASDGLLAALRKTHEL